MRQSTEQATHRSTPCNPQPSRREFGQLLLAGASGLTVLSPWSTPALAEEKAVNTTGWIDAHVHVWTPDVKAYPLNANFTVEQMQPPSFTPEELFQHTRPAGVSRIVLIQMSYYRFDNRYMLDTIARFPGVFSGVGIVDYRQDNVAETMLQLSRKGVRGFRLHSLGEPVSEWLTHPGMQQVWQTAGKHGLAVCPLINPQDLPVIAQMAAKYQDTRVVIDHFARIGVSGTIEAEPLQQLCALAKLPKVYVKTSAFYALGKKQAPYTDLIPMIKELVEAYGTKRLMWASDAPFQVQEPHSYAASLALVADKLDFLTAAEREDILRNTAENVFFAASEASR